MLRNRRESTSVHSARGRRHRRQAAPGRYLSTDLTCGRFLLCAALALAREHGERSDRPATRPAFPRDPTWWSPTHTIFTVTRRRGVVN
jgi:hypothetical protein